MLDSGSSSLNSTSALTVQKQRFLNIYIYIFFFLLWILNWFNGKISIFPAHEKKKNPIPLPFTLVECGPGFTWNTWRKQFDYPLSFTVLMLLLWRLFYMLSVQPLWNVRCWQMLAQVLAQPYPYWLSFIVFHEWQDGSCILQGDPAWEGLYKWEAMFYNAF